MPWNNNKTIINTTTASSQPQPGGGSASTNNGALTPITKRYTDPNMTDSRLLANRRCIYERPLPGDAYVTAHVERLQHGYFESSNTTDPTIDHVDFLAINFVFHPSDCDHHRFKSATIKVSVQNFLNDSFEKDGNAYPSPQEHPRFLMHAPHLIYGAVSPENLQWTFSLAGSLGISETPVAASLSPSGKMTHSYKVYEMMKIQGSARTWKSPHGPEFDIEDGEITWSLTENGLQRSGLPREFTFVFLVQKPKWDIKLMLSVHIDPVIDVWYGKFPAWWLNQSRYQPIPKRAVNFRHEVGQRFEPVESSRGFNFATLASSFDSYVNMPGSTFSSNVSPEGVYNEPNAPQMSVPSGSSSQPKRSSNLNYPQQSNPQQTHDSSDFWQAHSPFQQGWPRQSQYPTNPFAQPTRQMGEALGALDGGTINVNIMLDSNISSEIASAVLAGHRTLRASPVPRRSPVPRGSPALQGSPMGRTRSLRRTQSREGLNQSKVSRRLTAAHASTTDSNNADESAGFINVDGVSDVPGVTITPSKTAATIPNGTSYTPATKDSTPRSNGWSGRTATSAMNATFLPYGADISPPGGANGIQRQQNVSASGPRPSHSSSSKNNGQRNRYSYPVGFV